MSQTAFAFKLSRDLLRCKVVHDLKSRLYSDSVVLLQAKQSCLQTWDSSFMMKEEKIVCSKCTVINIHEEIGLEFPSLMFFFPQLFGQGGYSQAGKLLASGTGIDYTAVWSLIMITSLPKPNHKIVKRWKNPKSQSRNFQYWNMWWKSLNSWWVRCWNTENFCCVVWDSFDILWIPQKRKITHSVR